MEGLTLLWFTFYKAEAWNLAGGGKSLCQKYVFCHFYENPSILGGTLSLWKVSAHAQKRFSRCEKEIQGSEASLFTGMGNFCCLTLPSSCCHRAVGRTSSRSCNMLWNWSCFPKSHPRSKRQRGVGDSLLRPANPRCWETDAPRERACKVGAGGRWFFAWLGARVFQ